MLPCMKRVCLRFKFSRDYDVLTQSLTRIGGLNPSQVIRLTQLKPSYQWVGLFCFLIIPFYFCIFMDCTKLHKKLIFTYSINTSSGCKFFFFFQYVQKLSTNYIVSELCDSKKSDISARYILIHGKDSKQLLVYISRIMRKST